MASSAIDLSSGLVAKPKTTMPQASAPSSGGIDISSGLMPTQPAASSSPTSPTSQTQSAPKQSVLSQVGDFAGGVGRGFVKSAGQTVNSVSHVLNKIPVIGETLAPSAGVQAADQMETLHGVDEHVGAGLEQIAEFALGDAAAVKALSAASKLQKMSKIVGVLEEYPRLAKIIGTSMRQGGVSTAQGLAHGEDLGDAATQGVLTGGVGGAVEAGGIAAKGLINKIKPTTTSIAGEEIPTLASQVEGHAPIADQAATLENSPGFAQVQNKGAQQAVKNVASDAAQNSIDRVNATRPYSDIKRPSNFAQAETNPSAIHSFEDAAEQVRGAAKPVYEQLDKLSDNRFTGLNNQIKTANKVIAKPSSVEAANAAQASKDEAMTAMGSLFSEHADNIAPKDLSAAKLAWRDSIALDNVHTAVERAFNGISQSDAASSGVARQLNGGKPMMKSLGSLLDGKQGPEVRRVLGKDGVDNLYRIAALTSKPETATATREVGKQVARYIANYGGKGAIAGGFLGYETGGKKGALVGGLSGALLEAGGMKVLNKIATNPRAGKMLMDAVTVRATPRVYAPLISAALLGNDQESKDPTPQPAQELEQ